MTKIENQKNNKDFLDNKSMQTKLDENIQNFCAKYKFYPPKEEYYKIAGKNKNLIISHKSTIPDLVIYNKTFNKNYCFMDADTNEYNKFPRTMFRIKFEEENLKEHKEQEKILSSKMFEKNEPIKDYIPINKKEEVIKTSSVLNKNIKNNKDSNELFEIHSNQKNNIKTLENNEKLNKNISEINNEISKNSSSDISNNSIKILEEKNSFNIKELFLQKFLSNPNYIRKINKEIQDLLFKKDWTVYNQSGLKIKCYDSFELLKFLSNQIKENNKLDSFFVYTKNNKYQGDIIYICLFNSLPSLINKLIEDKQAEDTFKQLLMNYQFLYNNNSNNFGVGPNFNSAMNMFAMNLNKVNNKSKKI